MKILLTFFVLLFSSSVFADDISDFEIEGISIGDSLLDYMTEEKILEFIEITSKHYLYLKNPNMFGEVYIFNNEKFNTYKNISFLVKPEDKNYTIYSIRGMLDYVEDLEGCLKKEKEIVSEIEKILTQFDKHQYDNKMNLDPSGKSTNHGIILTFKTGDTIDVSYNDWEENFRKKNNFTEGLSVSVNTKEVQDWGQNY